MGWKNPFTNIILWQVYIIYKRGKLTICYNLHVLLQNDCKVCLNDSIASRLNKYKPFYQMNQRYILLTIAKYCQFGVLIHYLTYLNIAYLVDISLRYMPILHCYICYRNQRVENLIMIINNNLASYFYNFCNLIGYHD